MVGQLKILTDKIRAKLAEASLIKMEAKLIEAEIATTLAKMKVNKPSKW
jgi:hypothetical protein